MEAAGYSCEPPAAQPCAEQSQGLGREQKRSYGQALKSSALIGGASLLNIGFGIIRTKAMALILGPSGVGLLGLYNSVYDVVRSLADMGISSSGVRQIAEAVGSGDTLRISRTAITLRRMVFCTGALGALLLLIFCRPVSRLTFGDTDHVGGVALLALAVLFGEIAAGLAALVQGMRRIADLARMNVLGAFYGALFSIPIVYVFKERGVVPSLVVVAGMSILTAWWYARRVQVERVAITRREILGETSALLRLGFVFMASTLMTMGVAWLTRILIVRKFGADGMEAAGFYQAAWALGGLYFGFILQAMGTDFYPRLTGVAGNNPECNRMVNEQAEIGLLLAGPGVLGTLTLAPLVIRIFYSAKFGPAVEILEWICLGMLLRVISWPMAFILLAKGVGRLYFLTELSANAIQVSLIWGGIEFFGLEGAGMAFFVLYIFYGLAINLIVRNLSGFRWSVANRRLVALFVPLTAGIFIAVRFLPWLWVMPVGLTATLLSGVYALRTLCTLVPVDKLPKPLLAVCRMARLAPRAEKP